MIKWIKNAFGYSQKSFVKDIRNVLAEQKYTGSIEYFPDQDLILLADEIRISLTNIYPETESLAPSERKSRVRGILEVLLNPEKGNSWEDVATNILPKLRTDVTLAFRRYSIGENTENHPATDPRNFRSCGNGLSIEYVIDTETAMQGITYENFESWNITLEDVHKQAVSNFHRISEEPFDIVEQGLWCSPWGDSYDDSRILLTEKISALSIGGEPILFIPNRDCLLVADSMNTDAVLKAIEFSEKISEEGRMTTLQPYVLRSGNVIKYIPDENSPYKDQMDLITVKSLLTDYADQKYYLEEEFDKSRRDVFVATFSAVQNDEGKVTTYGTWSEGVPTYLPISELVALVRNESDQPANTLGLVGWEQLSTVCGNRMKSTDFLPGRIYVDSFPSDKELSQLTFT